MTENKPTPNETDKNSAGEHHAIPMLKLAVAGGICLGFFVTMLILKHVFKLF
ncbi:MAG TPA: hypothetical protein PK876_01970 [Elusimicrobiota bacterium]|nr:hypothetical protein [Elusimicrobiota bacterium]